MLYNKNSQMRVIINIKPVKFMYYVVFSKENDSKQEIFSTIQLNVLRVAGFKF